MAAKIRRSSQLGLPSFIYETITWDTGYTHAVLKVVNQGIGLCKMEDAMTCVWNSLRLPFAPVARMWRRAARRRRVTRIDPRIMSPHWRRDLGIDSFC